MSKPTFQLMWNNFPDHTAYPTLKDLYTALGGTAARNIFESGFGPNGNTCASRLSVALNKAGAPITRTLAKAAGAHTLTAADGSLIIYRVAEFKKYLLKILGTPAADKTSPFDSNFQGKAGIIAFAVNWGDASGHIALWNGSAYREPVHDNYSAYVSQASATVRTSKGEFWKLA